MNNPRLLFLVHQYGRLAGVELHTKMLVDGLAGRYDVSVAWPDGDKIQLLHGGEETTFVADPPSWPVAPDPAEVTNRSLAEIFRAVRPQIIHVQHFLHWPIGVIDQALGTGARVVVSFHDHFAISPQCVLRGDETAQETISLAYSRRIFRRDLAAYLRERRMHLSRSFTQAHALITVSPYIERKMAEVFPLRYRQIEYGIRPFEPLPKEPTAAGPRFGFLGQLVPIKGWESLVRGFAEVRRRHPTAELHLHGGQRPETAPGVYFHGAYESQDLPGICSRLDIGVVPSVVAETYCMVLSEMWRGGLPVAASDIGALRDRVIENVNGKKFAPGEPASIARALCWFAEHDEWRQWQLPQPRLAAEMVAEYDQLYQKLLGSTDTTSTPSAVDPLESSMSDGGPVGGPDDLLIVQVCGFVADGDGIYRLHSPSRALSRLKDVTVVDCHPYHRCLPQLAEQADVLILSSFDEDIFPMLERRRAAGRVTVLEANDYYFDPQPWNTSATRWINHSLEDWFCHLLRMSDGVQASTPELARRWRERTDRPVGVFRNQLADLPALPPLPSRPITIGWGGSLGHLADWYQLAPGLQAWLDANADVRLAVMTNDHARPFFRLAPERYHFQRFGTLAEYMEFLGRLDIGLAPLLPTDFNRCRSDVKFLEYAARGVVGVYADLEPYHDSVEHGRTGFLFRTEAELFACLDELVADARLRERVRRDAYAHVAEQRRLEQHIDERLTFYRQLLDAARRGEPVSSAGPRQPLSPSVADFAARDDRYWQLRPQGPEQVLEAAIEGPSTRETAAAMTRLVQQYPDYRAALQQLGAALNDLHDSDAALPYLERARQLNPLAAEPLCQLARLHHQQGNLQQARQMLEAAIELNPYSSRPWRFLLRLIPAIAAESLRARETAVDGRPWAERARQLHPASYSLALMGVNLYPRDEALALLEELLDIHAPRLRPDDVLGVASFSVAIEAIAEPCLDQPQAARLVRRAASVFPHSVRLSDLWARVLALEGRTAESHAEYARGQQLRRAALCYRAEFPKEDEHVPLRQIAEHLLPRDVE